jgi:hypothetical protein
LTSFVDGIATNPDKHCVSNSQFGVSNYLLKRRGRIFAVNVLMLA